MDLERPPSSRSQRLTDNKEIAASQLDAHLIKIAQLEDEDQRARSASGIQSFIRHSVNQWEPPQNIEFHMSTEEEVKRAQALTTDVLRLLPPIEAEILIQRFGLDGEAAKTLAEVGQNFSYGKERIRQLEAKGLRKARNEVRQNKLSPLVFTQTPPSP